MNSDQYEKSFYFGPQLNAGQVRSHIEINHSISTGDIFEPDVFNITTCLAGGIRDNLTYSAAFLYHNPGSDNAVYNSDSIVDFPYHGKTGSL